MNFNQRFSKAWEITFVFIEIPFNSGNLGIMNKHFLFIYHLGRLHESNLAEFFRIEERARGHVAIMLLLLS